MELPPVENPALITSHLISVSDRPRYRLPHLSGRAFGLLSLAVLPIMFLLFGQPNPPTLSAANRSLVSAYLADSGRTPAAVAQTDSAAAPLPDSAPSPSPTAELASITGPTGFNYQLSLAQGFLTKAITRSQQTATGQTEADRQQVLAYLQQALDAANQAIDSAPTQGLGFLVRARVYKTAAAVKPELTAMAEQDLAIARALGVSSDQLAAPNPLEYLPTVVAAPEEGNQASVSGETGNNAQSGRVILAQGNRIVDVSFPGLSPLMSLRVDPVDPSQNAQNAIFTVVSRVEGSGFTIQSTVPVANDIVLEWRAITE